MFSKQYLFLSKSIIDGYISEQLTIAAHFSTQCYEKYFPVLFG